MTVKPIYLISLFPGWEWIPNDELLGFPGTLQKCSRSFFSKSYVDKVCTSVQDNDVYIEAARHQCCIQHLYMASMCASILIREYLDIKYTCCRCHDPILNMFSKHNVSYLKLYAWFWNPHLNNFGWGGAQWQDGCWSSFWTALWYVFLGRWFVMPSTKTWLEKENIWK